MHSQRIVALLGGFWTTLVLACALATAQVPSNRKLGQEDKFRQLEEVLPTPNQFRTGSGAPAQLRFNPVDYDIEATIDDEHQLIIGKESIKYQNLSNETLEYLWLQLDANLLDPTSDTVLTKTFNDDPSPRDLNQQLDRLNFPGGFKGPEGSGPPRVSVAEPFRLAGKPAIVKTMLRLDLAEETRLEPGKAVTIKVEWSYQINDAVALPERSGYERFSDGNIVYQIAQWHPRMAAFLDTGGWQHKQFLGEGEFTLEFSNFDVRLTVPADHLLAATGILKNPEDVLSDEQQKRLKRAEQTDAPVFIVSPDEAAKNERGRSTKTKTWHFTAAKVRDFAFASSRKFIWDAKGVSLGTNGGKPVMAMSFYPNEAEGRDHFWSTYSTRAIEHTLRRYGARTFAFPYESAISVNGPIFGMEYPMICFNGPRPDRPDGSYSLEQKTRLIGVVVHEVGHNWFPMIVNSDERQWTWMDEGLNTYLEYLACLDWDDTGVPGVKLPIAKGKFPSGRGNPRDTAFLMYMSSKAQVPIMTNAESILRLGLNAYAKPATGLVILRETIFGRTREESEANFDHAFRVYANRWKFSRPMPADFFRTMEDASGVDLDWFWRGWFYTTDHVDLALEGFRTTKLDARELRRDLEEATTLRAGAAEGARRDGAAARDDAAFSVQRRDERPDQPSGSDRPAPARRQEDVRALLKRLERTRGHERAGPEGRREAAKVIEADRADTETYYYTVISVRNLGGLVMPVLLDVYYQGKRKDHIRIPAEIWRHDSERVNTVVFSSEPVTRVVLDPGRETADVDASNNVFPPAPAPPSRFELFRERQAESSRPRAEESLGPHKER